MTTFRPDLIPIGHMLEASRWAVSISEGRSRSDLAADLLLFLSLTKAVETIGEAANRVSDSTQSANPDVPWRGIIGMRNHLVHQYDNIDNDTLWLVVQEHLPSLMADLGRLLPDDFVPTPLR